MPGTLGEDHLAKKIGKVAVLGAGVMGAQIAGHLANCGFGVLLLDIKDEIVDSALKKLTKARPPALFTNGVLRLIKTGNIDGGLADACMCDWIIEVVPEILDIKRDLYKRIEGLLSKDVIISSNTSGISLSILTDGRSEGFRRSFLITHFFNPVRYMKLVELITGPETEPEKADVIKRTLSEGLGKGVVSAKDTPGFIANRIGVYAVMDAIHKTFDNGWPLDLVDQVLGKAASFAGSGIFRTADLVGLDTLMHVAKNSYELLRDDPFREVLKPPPQLEKMVCEGRLGTKSGIGFYKKDGEKILVLDTAGGGYREKISHRFDSLKAAKMADGPAERVRALFAANDDAAKIARDLILDILVYAATVADEIAESLDDIDKAMRWGYNWQLGPFELWEALGLDAAGDRAPQLIKEIRSGRRGLERPPAGFSVNGVKEARGVVAENAGASLVDLGDGVVCCGFHTKMNAIDPDIIGMLNCGLDLLDAGKYTGMLVANDADNFSVGANLFMIAMAISNKGWDQIEKIVRDFQDVGQRMRFSGRPVVMAPSGMTLGGGCEICLAAGNVVAAAETYMGLVELGVGLIPAGGGCKNMLLMMEQRHLDRFDPKNQIWYSARDGGPFPKVRDAFEVIALAKVSASARDTMEIGYLPGDSGEVLDRSRLTLKAKEFLLKLAGDYTPRKPREDISLPGRGGEMTLIESARSMNAMGIATDYDVVLATNLAHVLSGGNIATNHKAGEQDILDLEREIFLKLCGMEKTAERIQHMLTVGKPLRN